MKKLYFVRHAVSQMGTTGLVAGHTDTPLTDEGRSQAQAAGQAAKKLDINLIVSSPLSRSLETAQIIAKAIDYPAKDILTDSLLIERNHGAMEGKVWSPGFDYNNIKGAETDQALIARAQKTLDWINSLDSESILIVSHGAIGRAIRSILKPDYPFDRPAWLINAEIVRWL